MADTSDNEVLTPGVVGKDDSGLILTKAEGEEGFLLANGLPTGFLEDPEYGKMCDAKDGVYTYLKETVDSSGNKIQAITVVDCNKQQMIRGQFNQEGNYIVTVYTTDEATNGYTVNASSLGMGLSIDGTLQDPTLGVGVNLDPQELAAVYGSGNTDSFERDNVLSTANYVDNLGDVELVSGSFNKITSDGVVEEVSLFKDTFDNYVGSVGVSYNGNEPQTFTELYEFEQQYDIYETLTANFTDSITQTFENNDITWGNIDATFNNIMDLYKDAFYVGNLNISTVAEPIKDALKEAKAKIDTYLEEVSAEYSRIAAKKEEILAELAALETESTGGGTGSNTSVGSSGVNNVYHTVN